MKRFAIRNPLDKPFRGYLAPCSRCGLVVVHAAKTDVPFHMHRRSKLCADGARARAERGGKQ